MSAHPNAHIRTNEGLRARRPRLHYALAAPTAGLLAIGALAFGAPAASAAPGDESRAAARFLSGSVLDGTDLDEIAALQGVRAVNHGSPKPVTDTNDLNVSVLGNTVVDVPGGVTVPLADLVSVGAANQYAQASDEGVSRSASGAVSDAGVVDTSGGAMFPSDMRLDLAPLLQDPLTTVVDELVVSLQAVTGVAALDAAADGSPAITCDKLSSPEHCRDYQIAGGRLTIGAPALATLTGALTGAGGLAGQLDAAVADLAGPSGALAAAVSQLNTSLGALTGGPGLTATVTSDVDGAVAAVVDRPLVDADGVVTIDLASGTITVDLDKLMRANTGKGLNDLAPNTEILSAAVIADLAERIGDLLDSAAQNVLSAARTALDAATIKISGALCAPGSSGPTCSSGVGPVDAGSGLLVNVSGSVATVLDGTATTDVILKTAGTSTALPAGDVLEAVAAPVDAALFGTSGALSSLTTAVNTAVAGVLDALAPLFDALPGLVSLRANVQEAGPTEGSYREVAVRARVGAALTGGEGLLRLDLGRAEVGANLLGTATPGTATPVAGPPPAPTVAGPTLPNVGAGAHDGWLVGLGSLLLASGAALIGRDRRRAHA